MKKAASIQEQNIQTLNHETAVQKQSIQTMKNVAAVQAHNIQTMKCEAAAQAKLIWTLKQETADQARCMADKSEIQRKHIHIMSTAKTNSCSDCKVFLKLPYTAAQKQLQLEKQVAALESRQCSPYNTKVCDAHTAKQRMMQQLQHQQHRMHPPASLWRDRIIYNDNSDSD